MLKTYETIDTLLIMARSPVFWQSSFHPYIFQPAPFFRRLQNSREKSELFSLRFINSISLIASVNSQFFFASLPTLSFTNEQKEEEAVPLNLKLSKTLGPNRNAFMRSKWHPET